MDAMETHTARLASFSKVPLATRKRASEAKGAKSSKWPHKTPTPAQLATAGFYYHPTASRPDNATCFLCQSNLDGWEEDDEPIVEHLKHSPSCGWAIAMYIERNIESGNPTEENPMSEGMLSSRMMTFGAQWPHEDKRGWICKTRKMADAGWYYCPTPESDDFVKCSYCNLSLDGWEPKDNPYDEHQRRSPDCMFFTLSSSAKSKAGRPKKSRSSKASRLSTMSNMTAASDGQSMADFQANEGNTTLMSPTGSVKSAKIQKGSKKSGKSKKSTAKIKNKVMSTAAEELAQASSFVEPEDDDFEVKVERNSKKSARGKKRDSDEISMDVEKAATENKRIEIPESQPPPAKRRATRSRSSAVQIIIPPLPAQKIHDEDTHMIDADSMAPPAAPQSKKGAKGGRKRTSSAIRKASAASTASMASLRAVVPDDDDLDAALEADLDRLLTDDENEPEQLEVVYPKTRRLTRTKPGSRNATASVAPVRRTTRTSVMAASDMPSCEGEVSHPSLHKQNSSTAAITQENLHEGVVATLPIKGNAGKGKNKRKAASNQPNPKDENSSQKEHVFDKPVADEDKVPTRSKQPRSRQPSRQKPQHTTRASDLVAALENVNLSFSANNSMLGSIAIEDNLGHETDHSAATHPPVKAGRKKGPIAKPKGNGTTKASSISRQIEDIVQPSVDDIAPMQVRDITIDFDSVGSAEPQATEPESIEETKPKKTAKSANARATKPMLKAVKPPQPSSPQAELPSHVSPSQSISTIRLAEAKLNDNAAQPSNAASPAAGTTMASSPAVPLSIPGTSQQASPRQSSDAENEPPSSLPSELRPPLATSSPSRSSITCIPLAASTPTASPSRPNISKLQSDLPWTTIDVERFFSPSKDGKENDALVFQAAVNEDGGLPSPETKMTVEEWILFNAKKSEDRLRSDCERLVGRFEGEGVRALKSLEGIACLD